MNKKPIARVISEHLEGSGYQYNLENTASIKYLAIELQELLVAAGYGEAA